MLGGSEQQRRRRRRRLPMMQGSFTLKHGEAFPSFISMHQTLPQPGVCRGGGLPLQRCFTLSLSLCSSAECGKKGKGTLTACQNKSITASSHQVFIVMVCMKTFSNDADSTAELNHSFQTDFYKRNEIVSVSGDEAITCVFVSPVLVLLCLSSKEKEAQALRAGQRCDRS